MDARGKRCLAGFVILLAALALLLPLNLMIGSVGAPAAEIWKIITAGDRVSTLGKIIWQIRLPRICAVLILGGALSVSGLLLQSFFANPIAGPFILGISSGAKLVVALVMVFLLSRGIALGSLGMMAAAFAGSMLAMAFILAAARKVRDLSVLIICGMMIGYICSAVTDFVVTFANDSNIVNLHNWSMGSFSGISWQHVGVITVITGISLICVLFLIKPMSAYMLGETYARNAGVRLKAFRLALILVSSLLSAVVTAFAGPISFLGVAVPHLMRLLFKTSKPIVLVPACMAGGAAFCLFCDLLARSLFAPTELSISSVTAVFGAPVVIFMMISRHKRRSA